MKRPTKDTSLYIVSLLEYFNYPDEVVEHFKVLVRNNLPVPQIKEAKWLFGAGDLVIFPYIYVPSRYNLQKTLLTHALIHWKQQLECRWAGISFLGIYLFDWITGFSNKEVRFEREAYEFEKDPYHLINRMNHHWFYTIK